MIVVLFALCLFFPVVFGSGLFNFFNNDRQIFWPVDVNGEDLNINFLWAEEAWIDTLHVTDLNVETVVDYNVVGDVNAAGSVEAGVCLVSDCLRSLSDRDNWIDMSGPIWEFNNFGIFVDNDIESDNDIVAGNDLSCVNDLDVGDDADIGGSLVVVDDVNVGGLFGVVGVSYFGDESVFASSVLVEGDANFVDIGFSGFIFGDGSKLTGIDSGGDGTTYTGTHPIEINSDANIISLASDFNEMYVSSFDLNLELDGGFANSVFLVSQLWDGGGA